MASTSCTGAVYNLLSSMGLPSLLQDVGLKNISENQVMSQLTFSDAFGKAPLTQ
jgi:hypothetical protein